MGGTGEVDVGPATPAERAAALEVWRLSTTARGRPPGPEGIARVGDKLAHPGALLVVARSGGTVVGMALAEPAVDDAGAALPGQAHVGMVFVHPEHWGHGAGRLLMDGMIAAAAGAGYPGLQLWTGEGNERAQRLYRGAGFVPSGRTKHINGVGPTMQFVRRPDA